MDYIDSIFNNYKEKESYKGLIIKLRYDTQLQEELISKTSFLDFSASLQERAWYYKENKSEIELCPYCHKKKRKFRSFSKGLYKTCGDIKCQKIGIISGSKSKKRNYQESNKKAQETYFKKTGYYHNMQNPEFLEEYFDKYAKNHSGERYSIQSEKAKKNLQKRYTQNIKKKLNTLHFSLIKSYPDHTFDIRCNQCGNTLYNISRDEIKYKYKMQIGLCEKCDKITIVARSNFERLVYKELSKIYDKEILLNKKINSKYEVDLLIPDKKIIIECNGLYYHSEAKRNKLYHYEKKKELEELGYLVIQIWEDDWYNKQTIILSRLKSKLGLSKKIYARKCKIEKIDSRTAKSFLEENHLQGFSTFSIALGLTYNGKLMELATFGKTRKLITGQTDYYELLRLCTLNDYEVIGGFSKLIKYFTSYYSDNLISYSDLSWCSLQNTSYEKIGFVNKGWTGVNYYWFFNSKKYNRLNFTKQKLVKLGYDKNKSEAQIMHEDFHALKIYGPGNLKFVYQHH